MMFGPDAGIDGTAAGYLAPEVLAEANINPTTRLATDYLNHFNNVVMLLEFISTMPDFVEEVLDWKPLDYPGYFAASHFRHRDLAIAAYRAADRRVRDAFEAIIADLDEAMIAVQRLLKDMDPDDTEIAGAVMEMVRGRMRPLIAEAGGIINGSARIKPQSEAPSDGNAQQSIDELFH